MNWYSLVFTDYNNLQIVVNAPDELAAKLVAIQKVNDANMELSLKNNCNERKFTQQDISNISCKLIENPYQKLEKQEDYIPFGDKWVKEIRKWSKNAIIDFLRNNLIEFKAQKEKWSSPSTELPRARITLNEDDFRKLVSGQIIEKIEIKILLQDIGFYKMQEIITLQALENLKPTKFYKEIKHTKKYGVYHWDTFDNATLLLFESDDMEECRLWTINYYGDRLDKAGADYVDLVDDKRNIVKQSRVK